MCAAHLNGKQERLKKTKKKHPNTLIYSKNFNLEMHGSYEEEKKFKECQISYETTLNFLRNHIIKL